MSALQDLVNNYKKAEIKIRDFSEVESKLNKLIKGGHQSLQIISDFDMTISRHHLNGEICQSTHSILDNSTLMPDEFKTVTRAYFKKYYPIEIDHKLSIEEKIPLMVEWYMLSHNALVKCKINKSLIKAMVQKSRAILRDNTKELLSKLNEYSVPVLIFSGGIGDLIEEVLKKEENFFPNIKVVSNFMVYDENDTITGFKDPLIHMYNKNESTVQEDYFSELNHRNNALLLGDSLGDVEMDASLISMQISLQRFKLSFIFNGNVAEGMPNSGVVLKIAFLNDKIEERLETFLPKYDIVLIDDQSMDFVNLVLGLIV